MNMSKLLFTIYISFTPLIFSMKGKNDTKKLQGKKIAILVADGFEQSELVEPKKALEEAGAKTFIISPEKRKVRSWTTKKWGPKYSADVKLKKAKPSHYDALLLPGGVANPDKLRINPQAVAFVKSFVDEQKPIAAICHGPWLLINAQGVKGKNLTSYESLQADLTNAGANWLDRNVVIDGNLITSRKPEDIPAFNAAFIDLLVKPKAKTAVKSNKTTKK